MPMYPELEQAIDKVLLSTDESEEFNRRFKKLVSNYLDNNARRDDISDVVNLVNYQDEV